MDRSKPFTSSVMKVEFWSAKNTTCELVLMQILLWAGDEEFAPSAQVLYSDNFAEAFAAEDRVVAGDILISAVRNHLS